MQMDKSMLTAYQERWRSVAQVEADEQRQLSFAERWRKLNSLIRLATGLGVLGKDDKSQVDVVRNRWNRLKNLYLAELQGQAE